MASPLAEIDWTNLQDENVITAYNLLEKLYSERFNMAFLIGGISAPGIGDILDKYPFNNNSPDFGKATWPFTWGDKDGVTNNKISQLLKNYLDVGKITTAIGTTPASGFINSNYWYDESSIFTEFSITEWPRMDIPSTTNAKKWYDILTNLKWISRLYKNGGSATNKGFVERKKEGIFITATNNKQGYGDTGEPALSQLDTDWASLWTGPVSKELDTGTGPFGASNDFLTIDFDGSTTTADVFASKGYTTIDRSDTVNAGATGSPISFAAYGSFETQSTGSAYATWLATNNYVNDKIISMPSVTETDLGSNKSEYSINFTVPTQPSNDNGIIDVRSQVSIYENWDGDGGFEFFTPP